MSNSRKAAAAGLLLTLTSTFSNADIYEWQYVDPLNQSLGKLQSTTLAPDGAGKVAEPEALLDDIDLTKAWLDQADLTDAFFYRTKLENATIRNAQLLGAYLAQANLTNTDFSGSDLTDARLDRANLTGANLTDTSITHTNFSQVTGLTYQMLQSTRSFQDGNLTGTTLGSIKLHYWNFNNLNLTDTHFGASDLLGSSFAGANIEGADFQRVSNFQFSTLQSTASYQNQNLTGIILHLLDMPGWDLSSQNLTNANLSNSDTTGANFNDADLSNTNFNNAKITGASMSGSIITGARFSNMQQNSLTQAMLQSTQSFQNGSLSSLNLDGNDLTGWDFSGQNLTDASLRAGSISSFQSVLTDTDFSHANLTRADLSGSWRYEHAPRNNASFRNANLTDANLLRNDLTNADFTDTTIRGARLDHAIGFTVQMLESTGSYKAHDLQDVSFIAADLSDANLARQNLSRANFQIASLTNANLTNADLDDINLRDTIMHGTDLRGARNITREQLVRPENLWNHSSIYPADSGNLIFPDGEINGLNIGANATLRIWDFQPVADEQPIPISVAQQLTMHQNASLRMVFEDGEWGSTIGFLEPATPVTLGGTLHLEIASHLTVDELVALNDATLHLFDWTHASRSGWFDQITTHTPIGDFDTTNLAIDGTVVFRIDELTPGDTNLDLVIDLNDLSKLAANFGQPAGWAGGNFNGDNVVDLIDLSLLATNFNPAPPSTTIPEPAAAPLVLLASALLKRR
ncbi:pentapeptide repeat-containing protein [Mucisphaera sp.]|uniref:pentapeptide repeat-containing protein n=1 Tax=Mucisphaera sp. TaxID=2913024 RepID=UPI003D0A00D9